MSVCLLVYRSFTKRYTVSNPKAIGALDNGRHNGRNSELNDYTLAGNVEEKHSFFPWVQHWLLCGPNFSAFCCLFFCLFFCFPPSFCLLFHVFLFAFVLCCCFCSIFSLFVSLFLSLFLSFFLSFFSVFLSSLSLAKGKGRWVLQSN